MFKKNITEFIEKALQTNPSLRDDYQKMFCYVVCYEMGLKDFSQMQAFSQDKSLYDFFQALLKKEISTPETTRRTWQKVLENNSEIRGEKYHERHQQAEVVKQEVKELGQQNLNY